MSEHVQAFGSMDEMMAAMAASEDAANGRLLPGQIRLRDDVTHTRHWAQVIVDWDVIVYGVTPPIDSFDDEPGFDIKDNRERGYLTGVAYSVGEPDGEIGDTHVSQVVPIQIETFEIAKAAGWPSFSEVRTNPEHRELLQHLARAEHRVRS
jgi:hypothetical protein